MNAIDFYGQDWRFNGDDLEALRTAVMGQVLALTLKHYAHREAASFQSGQMCPVAATVTRTNTFKSIGGDTYAGHAIHLLLQPVNHAGYYNVIADTTVEVELADGDDSSRSITPIEPDSRTERILYRGPSRALLGGCGGANP